MEEDGGKPWKKGIVLVEFRPDPEARLRRALRLYQGGPIHADCAMLYVVTHRQLGIPRGESSGAIRVRRAPPVLGRIWFFWQHPRHEVRVSFKLGAVALLVSIISLVVAFG